MRAKMQEGQRYNSLVSLRKSETKGKWWFLCDCGKEAEMWLGNVTEEKSKSCCGRAKANTKHGLSKTGRYKVWFSMKNRCSDILDPAYKDYGARGIKVCDRWLKFENYNEDINALGPKPSAKHSIDRINNDGNYEPGNVRWATQKEQVANQRPRKMRTCCKRGHLYAEYGAPIKSNKNGRMFCRLCQNKAHRDERKRRNEAANAAALVSKSKLLS